MSKQNENIKVREYNVDKTEKINTLLTPFYDGNEHKYTQIKKTYKKIDKEWKLAKEETSILNFDQVHPNLKTEITIPIIIKRTNTDRQTLKNIYGFFLSKSKIKCHLPNMKLSVVDNLPFLHEFDGASIGCQSISPVLPSSFYEVNIDEKMKRISTKEAIKLVKSGVKIYEENPDASPSDRYRIFVIGTGRKF